MATRSATEKGNGDTAQTDRAAAAAHDAIDRIASAAADAETRIRKASDEAQREMRRRSGAAREQGEQTVESVRGYVNDHPLAALGIAFGAGIIAASLLRR